MQDVEVTDSATFECAAAAAGKLSTRQASQVLAVCGSYAVIDFFITHNTDISK